MNERTDRRCFLTRGILGATEIGAAYSSMVLLLVFIVLPHLAIASKQVRMGSRLFHAFRRPLSHRKRTVVRNRHLQLMYLYDQLPEVALPDPETL